MKQKRSKSQFSEHVNESKDEACTNAGGSKDKRQSIVSKEADCSTGVCNVLWKPDALAR